MGDCKCDGSANNRGRSPVIMAPKMGALPQSALVLVRGSRPLYTGPDDQMRPGQGVGGGQIVPPLGPSQASGPTPGSSSPVTPQSCMMTGQPERTVPTGSMPHPPPGWGFHDPCVVACPPIVPGAHCLEWYLDTNCTWQSRFKDSDPNCNHGGGGSDAGAGGPVRNSTDPDKNPSNVLREFDAVTTDPNEPTGGSNPLPRPTKPPTRPGGGGGSGGGGGGGGGTRSLPLYGSERSGGIPYNPTVSGVVVVGGVRGGPVSRRNECCDWDGLVRMTDAQRAACLDLMKKQQAALKEDPRMEIDNILTLMTDSLERKIDWIADTYEGWGPRRASLEFDYKNWKSVYPGGKLSPEQSEALRRTRWLLELLREQAEDGASFIGVVETLTGAGRLIRLGSALDSMQRWAARMARIRKAAGVINGVFLTHEIVKPWRDLREKVKQLSEQMERIGNMRDFAVDHFAAVQEAAERVLDRLEGAGYSTPFETPLDHALSEIAESLGVYSGYEFLLQETDEGRELRLVEWMVAADVAIRLADAHREIMRQRQLVFPEKWAIEKCIFLIGRARGPFPARASNILGSGVSEEVYPPEPRFESGVAY